MDLKKYTEHVNGKGETTPPDDFVNMEDIKDIQLRQLRSDLENANLNIKTIRQANFEAETSNKQLREANELLAKLLAKDNQSLHNKRFGLIIALVLTIIACAAIVIFKK